MPKDKNADLILDDIIRALPSLEEGVKLIGFSKLLSNAPAPESTMGQADLVERYGFKDPIVNKYVTEFQNKLRGVVSSKIQDISDKSKEEYGFGYDYMLPSKCTFGVQI